MIWLRLAWASAWSRRLALGLVMLSLMVSTVLLLAVSQLRTDVRNSFSQAVSGVDLIVGPRGSSTELLLYTVFQLGRPSRSIPAEALSAVRALPSVAWALPLQLGDRYREFPVWGTEPELLERFRVQDQGLLMAQGRFFVQPSTAQPEAQFELVLGAEVARKTQHQLGDRLTLSHGTAEGPGTDHSDRPFQVVGILAPAGGPIDRAVLVSVQGFEALHAGMGLGLGPMPGTPGFGSSFSSMTTQSAPAGQLEVLQPRELNAVFVGLHSPAQVFSARRAIEATRWGRLPIGVEPTELMAVLPGLALDELWSVLSVLENSFLLIGLMVSLAGAASISAVLLVSLSARRRELAILRALGASPLGVLGLVLVEALMLSVVGMALGVLIHQGLLWVFADLLRTEMGISVALGTLPLDSLWALGLLMLIASASGLVPAHRAYRLSLVDGLQPPTAG